MEQAKYWMWIRKKHLGDHQPLLNSPQISLRLPPVTSAIDGESWEEKAFAEDSAGLLGGCIWPPRSYSCSFCGREFRSAQALGGHMNVHRRDRARMKQSSIVEEEEEEEDQQAGVVVHNRAALLNTNLNPNPSYGFEAVSNFGEELRLGEMGFRLKRDLDEEDDELKGSCKKKKMSSMINLSPEIVEELDLELRLGDLPKGFIVGGLSEI